MAKWMNIIDLTRSWDKANEDVSFIPEVCKDIIKGLKNIKHIDEDLQYDVEELIEEFEFIQEDPCYDNFNYNMEVLYDLADTSLDNTFGGKKVAWIKTV